MSQNDMATQSAYSVERPITKHTAPTFRRWLPPLSRSFCCSTHVDTFTTNLRMKHAPKTSRQPSACTPRDLCTLLPSSVMARTSPWDGESSSSVDFVLSSTTPNFERHCRHALRPSDCSQGRRDNASQFPCALPERCCRSKSKSAILSSHREACPFTSGVRRKYTQHRVVNSKNKSSSQQKLSKVFQSKHKRQ